MATEQAPLKRRRSSINAAVKRKHLEKEFMEKFVPFVTKELEGTKKFPKTIGATVLMDSAYSKEGVKPLIIEWFRNEGYSCQVDTGMYSSFEIDFLPADENSSSSSSC